MSNHLNVLRSIAHTQRLRAEKAEDYIDTLEILNVNLSRALANAEHKIWELERSTNTPNLLDIQNRYLQLINRIDMMRYPGESSTDVLDRLLQTNRVHFNGSKNE